MVDGVYKYVAPKKELDELSEYNSALILSIREIKYALNNVVVRTAPGLAQAVAAGVDSLRENDILGSVAGDDTIILVTSSEEASERIAQKLSKIAER